MVQLRKEFFLVHYRVDRALSNNPRFQHFFHGIKLFCSSFLDLPHLSKATSSDHILECKIVFANLYKVSTIKLTLDVVLLIL